MVWCDTRKIIFIHIPKTGGTTIEHSIWGKDGPSPACGYFVRCELLEDGTKPKKAVQHYTCNEYKKFYPEKYRFYWKFSIVRHPYRRYISDKFWNPVLKKLTIDESLDLIEIIVNNSRYNDNIYYDHFMPQTLFIYDENDNLMVDKLFKYEHYKDIPKELKLSFINVERKTQIGTNKNLVILTENQKERLNKLYSRDFELLGYSNKN